MAWTDYTDGLNEEVFATFGETAAYGDDETAITVVRRGRPGDQPEEYGAVEAVLARLADFTTRPAVGDEVTVGGQTYAVVQVRQPDLDGTVELLLGKR